MKAGIIGGGKVGCCLAEYLKKSGVLKYITASTEEGSQILAEKFQLEQADNSRLIEGADVIFLTVPDRKIKAVADEIAQKSDKEQLRGKLFIHCSGSLSLDVLEALAAKGAQTGSMHPLQSFAAGVEVNLQGVYMAVDGNEQVRAVIEKIVHLLGGYSFFVPAEERILYHCAACICSNYAVTLEYLAKSLMERWVGNKSEAWNALKPLFQGTVRNMQQAESLEKALTGPIARGDSNTVAAHLAKLPPEYYPVYSSLGLLTAQIALTNGTIDSKTMQQICSLLRNPEVN